MLICATFDPIDWTIDEILIIASNDEKTAVRTRT
jgi:hypothetical protein